MTSSYTVNKFRERLRELCDEETIRISFLPTIFEAFQNNPPFLGKIKKDSFVLSRNSRLFPTSYRINGTYHEEGEKTVVNFSLNYNKFLYYFLRLMPVIIMLAVDILLLSKEKVKLHEALSIDLFIAIGFLAIPIDNYRGKLLLKRFVEEMDIDYSEPKP